jgi:hypothetical protein
VDCPTLTNRTCRDRKIWVLRNGTITRQFAGDRRLPNLRDAGDVLLGGAGHGGKPVAVAVPLDIDGYWASSTLLT